MTAITLRSLPAEAGRPNTISGTLGDTPSSTLDSIALFNDNAGADASHNVFFTRCRWPLHAIIYTINTSSSRLVGVNQRRRSRKLRPNVTVCAVTNACYQFVNWTEGSNVVSSSLCHGFTVQVTATWLLTSAKPITRSPRAPRRRKEERRRRRIQGMRSSVT